MRSVDLVDIESGHLKHIRHNNAKKITLKEQNRRTCFTTHFKIGITNKMKKKKRDKMTIAIIYSFINKNKNEQSFKRLSK